MTADQRPDTRNEIEPPPLDVQAEANAWHARHFGDGVTEAAWQLMVEIPAQYADSYGERIFDAVCETVEGCTDRRSGWDPIVHTTPRGATPMTDVPVSGGAPVSDEATEPAAPWASFTEDELRDRIYDPMVSFADLAGAVGELNRRARAEGAQDALTKVRDFATSMRTYPSHARCTRTNCSDCIQRDLADRLDAILAEVDRG